MSVNAALFERKLEERKENWKREERRKERPLTYYLLPINAN
jgi:hypothetical protein